MPSPDYPWQRFWCLLGSQWHSDGTGYLLDPSTEVGRVLNGGFVRFAQIAARSCLGLLGEPGIGKSNHPAPPTQGTESLALDEFLCAEESAEDAK
jgi:predicted ATP-dependent serine protease